MSYRFFGALACEAALTAAALSTGIGIYFLLAALIMLMLLYAIISVLANLFTARVELQGAKKTAVRGEELTLILRVFAKGVLPAGSFRLILSVPGGAGRSEIGVACRPFIHAALRHTAVCAHRGVCTIGAESVTVRDIFGFFQFTRKLKGASVRVSVYPSALRMAPMPLKSSDMGSEYRAHSPDDNASPSDVRAWQDGDELKKVHWKLSLRKRELIVRTFEESAKPDALIIPDLTPVNAPGELKLILEDLICDAALGAAKAQIDRGDPVRLPLECARPSEKSARSRSELPGFSDALMRVNFDCPYPYEQVLLLARRRMQRTGGAVLITSRMSSKIADIALRMQKTGLQVRLLWITDAPKSETLKLLERLRMSDVLVGTVDPWQKKGETELFDA